MEVSKVRLYWVEITMMYPALTLHTGKHPIFTMDPNLRPIWLSTILWVMLSEGLPGFHFTMEVV